MHRDNRDMGVWNRREILTTILPHNRQQSFGFGEILLASQSFSVRSIDLHPKCSVSLSTVAVNEQESKFNDRFLLAIVSIY